MRVGFQGCRVWLGVLLTWRFMVLSNPYIICTFNPIINLLGYLRGLYVGYNYTYNGSEGGGEVQRLDTCVAACNALLGW